METPRHCGHTRGDDCTELITHATPNPMTTEHYRCEHCGTVYDHELLTRVHITRSDDEAHRNHSGLMPECEIEVVDASGTLRERRSRRPE